MTSKINQTTHTPVMAEEGQLHWVMRPISVLSSFRSSEPISSTTSVWWPSLLFNDYGDFQTFFSDEFKQDTAEVSKTKKLMMSRIFQNMAKRKPVMIARLLGRSIEEYVEIVEVGPDSQNSLNTHESTDFTLFMRMPQDITFAQMDPAAFAVSSAGKTDGEMDGKTTIIDDELYMSYMLALDLAATTRMNPSAPNKSLGSMFRDMGRDRLVDLAPSIKKVSELTTALNPSDSTVLDNQGVNKEEEKTIGDRSVKDTKDSDSDSGSNEEADINENAASIDNTPQMESKSPDTGISVTEPTSSHNSVTSVSETSSTPKIEAKFETPVESSTKDQTQKDESICPNEDDIKHNKEDKTNADMVDTSSICHSTSATIVSHSSEIGEGAETGSANDTNSPKELDEEEESGNKCTASTPSTAAFKSPRPPKRVNRVTSPRTPRRKKLDLPKSSINEDNGVAPKESSKEKSPAAVAAASSFTTPRNERSREKTNEAAKTTEEEDSVRIATSPSPTARKQIDFDGPNVLPDDSFDEVCAKLGSTGWTIDIYAHTYFAPNFGFDDIKMNKHLKGTHLFLGKDMFIKYLKKTFHWTGNNPLKLRKRRTRSNSNAVTPSSSRRSKRTRWSPFDPEGVYTPRPKLSFASEEEYDFYCFANLMPMLKDSQGWGYKKGKVYSWNYVLPGGRCESEGGEHMVDFFHEENEVVEYCKNLDYFGKRKELGLLNRD